MIPFFVSDFSIGRSILKPKDILALCQEAGLKEVFLVEDNMTSFLPAQKLFPKHDIALRYGVRFNICNDVTSDDKKHSSFKIILFALNDEGCKELYHLYTRVQTECDGYLDEQVFKQMAHDNLLLVHPFYDSYLYQNTFYFKNCVFERWIPDRELYAWEENNLPMDMVMHKKLEDKSTLKVKTILYHYRADVEAYQTYRLACNRSFGRQRTLSAPNLSHFGSDEFCFQSYMENVPHGETTEA